MGYTFTLNRTAENIYVTYKIDFDTSYAYTRTGFIYLNNKQLKEVSIPKGTASYTFDFTNLVSEGDYQCTVRWYGEQTEGRVFIVEHTEDFSIALPSIEEWSWYKSNGSATKEQTIASHNALLNKTEVYNFYHEAWNDIVTKIYQAYKAYFGNAWSWNNYYASYTGTQMLSSDDYELTAKRFNSVITNINYDDWDWEYDKTQEWYLGQKTVKVGNVLYAHYIEALIPNLNNVIRILNGTTERRYSTIYDTLTGLSYAYASLYAGLSARHLSLKDLVFTKASIEDNLTLGVYTITQIVTHAFKIYLWQDAELDEIETNHMNLKHKLWLNDDVELFTHKEAPLTVTELINLTETGELTEIFTRRFSFIDILQHIISISTLQVSKILELPKAQATFNLVETIELFVGTLRTLYVDEYIFLYDDQLIQIDDAPHLRAPVELILTDDNLLSIDACIHLIITNQISSILLGTLKTATTKSALGEIAFSYNFWSKLYTSNSTYISSLFNGLYTLQSNLSLLETAHFYICPNIEYLPYAFLSKLLSARFNSNLGINELLQASLSIASHMAIFATFDFNIATLASLYLLQSARFKGNIEFTLKLLPSLSALETKQLLGIMNCSFINKATLEVVKDWLFPKRTAQRELTFYQVYETTQIDTILRIDC